MGRRLHILSGAALALTAAGLMAAVALNQLQRSHSAKVTVQLEAARKDLQTRLTDRLALVRGLAAFVGSNPSFTQEEFDRFSSVLVAEQTGIRSLQLAPQGVITYLTQPELNREAIGLDLLRDSKYTDVLREAISIRTYLVAGPVSLIQGGSAIIGRLSVHLPDPQTGKDAFWGFASVLIDPQALTEGLESLEAAGRERFALRVLNDGFVGNAIVYGEPCSFEDPCATVDIQHPSGHWELVVSAPVTLASAPPYWLPILGVGFCLAALLGVWLYWLLRRPAELRLAVEQATDALRKSEGRLMESRKFDALGQLTGGLAHDFNNILAVVQGSMELLEFECGDNPAARESIFLATDAARKGADLTGSMLSFASQRSLEPKHCDLDALIESMGSLLNRTLGPGIEVRTELGAFGHFVHIDSGEFEAALLQLAVNAKHAMPEGGTLLLRTSRVDHFVSGPSGEASPHVLCTISDNGTGMTSDVLEHAFEPFYTTRPGVGSGLGLSMIYGFVNQSHGEIEIKSQVNGGTTVGIYLPVAHEDALREVVLRPLRRSPDSLRGRVALVTEDNEAVRRVVVTQLKSFGMTVVEAEDAAAADRLHRAGRRFDLLLTDINMPGEEGGFGLAKRLRDRQADLAIVFMSGYEADQVRPAGLEGPMLHKPFGQADLKEALEGALLAQGAALTPDPPATADQGRAAAGVSGEG